MEERKSKVNLSNIIGITLLIGSLIYVFLPFYLSVRHDVYYEGKPLYAVGLFVASVTLLWLPESKVREIIINFFHKFGSSDSDK